MLHTAKVFRKVAVFKFTEDTSSEANREAKAFSGFCRDVSPHNICCSSDKVFDLIIQPSTEILGEGWADVTTDVVAQMLQAAQGEYPQALPHWELGFRELGWMELLLNALHLSLDFLAFHPEELSDVGFVPNRHTVDFEAIDRKSLIRLQHALTHFTKHAPVAVVPVSLCNVTGCFVLIQFKANLS